MKLVKCYLLQVSIAAPGIRASLRVWRLVYGSAARLFVRIELAGIKYGADEHLAQSGSKKAFPHVDLWRASALR
jgi:hypothetical protein